MKSKRDEHSDYLRKCMAAALIKLMTEKSLEKITAQEIATLADVGRATWFRLFHTKEDAITWHIITLWNDYVKANGFETRMPTVEENSVLFYNFNYENRELMKLIYKQGMKYTVYEAYYKLLNSTDSSDVLVGYIANTAAYGIVGMIDQWIRRDFKETPEELINLMKYAQQNSSHYALNDIKFTEH